METKELDRISYALGLSMGNNFKSSGIETIDVKDFADGVAAVFDGANPKMTYDEAKEEIRKFFEAMEARQQEAAAQMGKVNQEAGEAFLKENKTRENVKTTVTGLQYEVLEEGTGISPEPGDQVTVHYTGKLIDGTVFDESKEPVPMNLNRVIRGFSEGLKMMNKGSKYTLYIPGDLAYGMNGTPDGSIPPMSTLVFEVEVTDVTPAN